MKLSLVLLGVSLVGMVGGAFLLGVWAVGLALIFWAGLVGVYALTCDLPGPPAQPEEAAVPPAEFSDAFDF